MPGIPNTFRNALIVNLWNEKLPRVYEINFKFPGKIAQRELLRHLIPNAFLIILLALLSASGDGDVARSVDEHRVFRLGNHPSSLFYKWAIAGNCASLSEFFQTELYGNKRVLVTD